jgi:hypothetical protein
MTTLVQLRVPCTLCGAENRLTGIGSTNSFGSPDLDTRPPEMRRSTMFSWVQRCAGCGYCAPDLKEARPGAREVVESPEYRAQLADASHPELANLFLCHAMVSRGTQDPVGEGWALIHAAWVCDDAGLGAGDARCRERAAEAIGSAKVAGLALIPQAGGDAALLADLLRRAGRFDEVRRVVAAHRPGRASDMIEKILAFEADLAERGDAERYTMDGALGPPRLL